MEALLNFLLTKAITFYFMVIFHYLKHAIKKYIRYVIKKIEHL